MKINIYASEDQKQNGYENFSIYQLLENITILDISINDAQAKEIVIYGALEYLPANNIETIIQYLMKKLRKGGKFIISGIDAYAIAKDYTEYKITTNEFLTYMFGAESRKNSCIKLSDLVNSIMDISYNMKITMKVIKKRIEKYEYVLEMERI